MAVNSIFYFLSCVFGDNLFAMPKADVLSAGLLWFALAAAHADITTNANGSQPFQFKFELNKPLIYAVDMKTRGITDGRSGERTSLTRNSSDTHYKIKLTATRLNHDGTTTVCYEPFDFEQDIQSVGPNGLVIDTSIRGLEIISKQNGIVVVDTEKGIGMSQTQNMKLPIYPRLLSGYFDFNSTGYVKRFHGDMPFVDVWKAGLKYSMNFFYITFPTNTVAFHDSWTNCINLKSVGGVFFNGDGFIQPWIFIREPNQTTTNGEVACFSLYESDNYKNVDGYLDQLGQQTSVAIPEHNESMNATFLFDQQHGRLVSVKKSDTSHDEVNMMVQGNPTGGYMDNEAETSLTLISP